MKTKIQNATHGALNLGFVPPHGVRLPRGGSRTFDGGLRTVLASGLKRYSRQRELRVMTEVEETGTVVLTVWRGSEDPILIRDGYFVIDGGRLGGPAYEWDDIEAAGLHVPGFDDDEDYDDDTSDLIAMPFPFDFFGWSCSGFRVCSNGFIEFDNDDDDCCSQYQLPDVYCPLNMAAAFFADLYLRANVSKVRYKVLGTAPNRRLVVTFFNVIGYFKTADDFTFQITVYEGPSGAVRCQYKRMALGPVESRIDTGLVIGLNSQTGLEGITYQFISEDDVQKLADLGLDEVVVGFRKVDQVSPWPRKEG